MADVAVSYLGSSFEVIVLPHLSAAHDLAWSLIRDVEAAEDVLQDAWVGVLSYVPSFKRHQRAWMASPDHAQQADCCTGLDGMEIWTYRMPIQLSYVVLFQSWRQSRLPVFAQIKRGMIVD